MMLRKGSFTLPPASYESSENFYSMKNLCFYCFHDMFMQTDDNALKDRQRNFLRSRTLHMTSSFFIQDISKGAHILLFGYESQG